MALWKLIRKSKSGHHHPKPHAPKHTHPKTTGAIIHHRLDRDELPRQTLPRSLPLGQFLGRREERIHPHRPDALSRFIKETRLPYVGLRSQAERNRSKYHNPQFGYRLNFASPIAQNLFDLPRQAPAVRTECMRRAIRKEILFRVGIAGLGKRRSPGSGGTYHRTPQSQESCRRK